MDGEYFVKAENFRNARKQAGITQQQVADVLGLDRTAIAQYERVLSRPNLKNLPKICEMFNVSMEELLVDKWLKVIFLIALQ